MVFEILPSIRSRKLVDGAFIALKHLLHDIVTQNESNKKVSFSVNFVLPEKKTPTGPKKKL